MIDAHQHFWRLSRGDYAWPNESVAAIFRDYGPEHLEPHLARAGVERTVLVQATDTVAETEFLLDLAERTPFVAGVVGWVDLVAADAIATIDRLRARPALRGLRPMLQNIAETDWILQEDARPALDHMSRVGLAFDALVQPRHLSVLGILADRHPDLRIVVDHLAKPAMGREPDGAWVSGMNALAERPNVWCKLSGMVTEAWPGWRVADLSPFVETVLRAFGPERTIWGSDWPVVELVADYQGWVDASHELLKRLGEADRDRVFGANAEQFYGLT